MTPAQYLKLEILKTAHTWKDNSAKFTAPDTGEAVDQLYEQYKIDPNYCDYLQDARNEAREYYSEETEIEAPYNRNYETKSVARKINGKWIGWTFWYGGGKHSDPYSIDWISDAYFLECEEKEVKIIQRTFKIAENKDG